MVTLKAKRLMVGFAVMGGTVLAPAYSAFASTSSPSLSGSQVNLKPSEQIPSNRAEVSQSPQAALTTSTQSTGVIGGAFNIITDTTKVSNAIQSQGPVGSVSPPDPISALGVSTVLVATNDTVVISSRTNTANTFTETMQQLFSGSGAGAFTDPSAVFDPTTGKYFLTVLGYCTISMAVCGGNAFSAVQMAVISDSISPQIFTYQIDNSSLVLHDQPKIGVTGDKVAVGWTDFYFQSGQVSQYVQQTTLAVIQKSALVAGASNPSVSILPLQSSGNIDPPIPVSTVSWANVTSQSWAAAAGYTSPIGNDLYVWANDSSGALYWTVAGYGPTYSLTSSFPNSVSYYQTLDGSTPSGSPISISPPGTLQNGGGTPLDGDDNRFQVSENTSGSGLYPTLSGNTTCSQNGVTFTCGFVVKVTPSGALVIPIEVPGYTTGYPSITSIDGINSSIIGTVTASSASLDPSVYSYIVTPSSSGYSEQLSPVNLGLNSYSYSSSGPSLRWGDYLGPVGFDLSSSTSAQALNPIFYAVGEYADNSAPGNSWTVPLIEFSPPGAAAPQAPTSAGYWEVASDGGIFSFGDAAFYGSMGGHSLNQPIVGIASTPDGKGYWEVASDGGIFSFGDAAFYGSMGGHSLNQPIVGIASTPDGKGYWEVASDGGIFSFGDAAFYGSMGGHSLVKPIVSIISTPDGKGYWEVASDGGIFSFGDAAFYGSMGGHSLVKPIVSIISTPDGKGYWEVASDGGIFSFGDAAFYGSMGGHSLNQPIVGGAGI